MDNLFLAIVEETIKHARLIEHSRSDVDFSKNPRHWEILHCDMSEKLSSLKRNYDNANNEIKTKHDLNVKDMQSDKENMEFFELEKNSENQFYLATIEENDLEFVQGITPIAGFVVWANLDMDYILQKVAEEIGV